MKKKINGPPVMCSFTESIGPSANSAFFFQCPFVQNLDTGFVENL